MMSFMRQRKLVYCNSMGTGIKGETKCTVVSTDDNFMRSVVYKHCIHYSIFLLAAVAYTEENTKTLRIVTLLNMRCDRLERIENYG